MATETLQMTLRRITRTNPHTRATEAAWRASNGSFQATGPTRNAAIANLVAFAAKLDRISKIRRKREDLRSR